jgi:hypothetical protein
LFVAEVKSFTGWQIGFLFFSFCNPQIVSFGIYTTVQSVINKKINARHISAKLFYIKEEYIPSTGKTERQEF